MNEQNAVTNKQAREAIDRILNFCEEIDNHIPPDETTGYKMLPDYFIVSRYLNEADYRKIVNCKDCENCREYTKWNGRNYLGCTRLAELCDGQIVEVSENDFCSFAKMKGGAE